MARDNRIERAERTRPPAQQERQLTTSERVQLLVSNVLNDVNERLEEKRAQTKVQR